MIKLSEEEMKDEGRRRENRRFEILNKEEGDSDKTSLGSGHFIKMGYDMVYNYGKCHHLIFHNLHI